MQDIQYIECLEEKGIIDSETADRLTDIFVTLPTSPSSLLKLLVALQIDDMFPPLPSSSSSSSSSSTT